MFRELDHSNPVNVIKDLAKKRAERVGNKIKENKTVNELKTAIRKVAPKKEDWASFIESIKC
jgi:hypothetical protein